MKKYVRDLLEISKTLPKKSYWRYDDLAEEYGINYIHIPSEDNKFTFVSINPHICTDTWVGMEAIFLEDDLVAVSYQSSRKSSITYYFINKEMKDKVYNYLIKFLESNPEEYTYLTEELLNEEYDIGYKVKYAYTHIGEQAYYMFDDEAIPVLINKGTKWLQARKYQNFYDIEIILPNGTIIVVNINSLLFPYFPEHNLKI